ncbi:MAG: N-acetylglucosaminyldiphosphoundecaprenol N-acetyl-beta-D-mannosaminyltransferase [Cellvibrionaceae bacterium]|jgi:N-acetylglucosaminyldiphosphoundecaprenol N-acetyl-beta-D-mannosaminyltransferase
MGQTLAEVDWWMSDSFVRESPRLHQICTTNPEFVMRARQDADFLAVLDRADLCLADGIGLVYASRYQGQTLPERVPGSELVYHLAEACAKNGWRLFLLGAAEGVADEAGAILQQKYPQLNIAGTWSGSPSVAENAEIVGRINRSAADVLYVAYGAPNQDKWIARNKELLTTVRVAVGIGGSLDFITGRSVRASGRIQSLGLEWLHRLLMEPWRWRRMLTLPQFVIRVLLSSKQSDL